MAKKSDVPKMSAAIREALTALDDAREKKSSEVIGQWIVAKYPSHKAGVASNNFAQYVSGARGKLNAPKGKKAKGAKKTIAKVKNLKTGETLEGAAAVADFIREYGGRAKFERDLEALKKLQLGE